MWEGTRNLRGDSRVLDVSPTWSSRGFSAVSCHVGARNPLAERFQLHYRRPWSILTREWPFCPERTSQHRATVTGKSPNATGGDSGPPRVRFPPESPALVISICYRRLLPRRRQTLLRSDHTWFCVAVPISTCRPVSPAHGADRVRPPGEDVGLAVAEAL